MEAYRFKDEKSDKFWRIEYDGTAFAINYGKTGTNGQYQVKEFDSKEECEKEAKKIIASKVKKGYKPYPEFDPLKQFYFDDDGIGLHRLTSHPNFREGFSDELYYDCIGWDAPFGSDKGSEALSEISENIRKNKEVDFAALPRKIVEKTWERTYIPPENISREVVEQLVKKNKANLTRSDRATIATAIAQIKITGRLDDKLKEAALNSIRRMEITAVLLDWNTSGKTSEIAGKMLSDLERFKAGGTQTEDPKKVAEEVGISPEKAKMIMEEAMIPNISNKKGLFEGTVRLDYWKTFFGRGASISLNIGGDRRIEEVNETHKRGYDDLVDNQKTILHSLLHSLKEIYPELQDEYGYEEDEKEEYMPDIESEKDFKSLLKPKVIFIHDVSKDDIPYIGFEFECTWDEEHGLGMMTHKGRVIKIGGADAGILSWIAKNDLES